MDGWRVTGCNWSPAIRHFLDLVEYLARGEGKSAVLVQADGVDAERGAQVAGELSAEVDLRHEYLLHGGGEFADLVRQRVDHLGMERGDLVARVHRALDRLADDALGRAPANDTDFRVLGTIA